MRKVMCYLSDVHTQLEYWGRGATNVLLTTHTKENEKDKYYHYWRSGREYLKRRKK